tara:strand:+ start:426 stop:1508 length:1083 start_codon:yes stop_codon:yes gene_type:complete
MYKVISANRGSHKAPKNWRVFEQEYLEKHFGSVINVDGEDGKSVIDTFSKYENSIKYIRWYPCPETCTKEEYDGILRQSDKLNLDYITNSAKGFINVQSKEEAFKTWKLNGVNCPDYFVYKDRLDFYEKIENSSITYPYLLRVNNSVGGRSSVFISNKSEIEKGLELVETANKSRTGINRKMMCIQFVNTIDKERDVNISYRIHVAGDKVISGYGRVVPKENWIAITAGSFQTRHIDNWVYYNELCQKIMVENEKEIVKSVKSLDLNHQGVDLVIDQETNKLCFLEVQPTYAAGYPNNMGNYSPPFYNPYDKNLVNFLLQNKSELEQRIPLYYFNWLDKRNHFDIVYKTLKEYIDVRTQY